MKTAVHILHIGKTCVAKWLLIVESETERMEPQEKLNGHIKFIAKVGVYVLLEVYLQVPEHNHTFF